MSDSGRVEAVTLDFFNTLVFHREGRGRGRRLVQYLQAQGYQPRPWEHRVLYRLFERHAVDYSPNLPESERRHYLVRLACGVFSECGIDAQREEVLPHAQRLWEILGPSSLEVFPDVLSTLESLRARGIRLAVISNWQCGLKHFVAELGLAPYFEHVIGSAEYGFEKPDRRLFGIASHLLGIPSRRIFHIGDSFEEDYLAARAAGYRVALLQRESGEHDEAHRVTESLRDLWNLEEFADVFFPERGHITRR